MSFCQLKQKVIRKKRRQMRSKTYTDNGHSIKKPHKLPLTRGIDNPLTAVTLHCNENVAKK